MSRLIFALLVATSVPGGPATAAPLAQVAYRLQAGAIHTPVANPVPGRLRDIIDDEVGGPADRMVERRADFVIATTAATSHAVTIGTPRGRPPILEVEALAGHRSFDTMIARRAPLGWQVHHGGSVLGVGSTGTYGIRVARRWRLTPFVSVDYNRIDSGRHVDATSPRPFIPDNADTGISASTGATLAHRFGPGQGFRALAFGALVAGARDGGAPREFGSIGARFVNALGNRGDETVWEEMGFGLDYRLTPRAQLDTAIVHTFDRIGGDTLAAKLGLKIVL